MIHHPGDQLIKVMERSRYRVLLKKRENVIYLSTVMSHRDRGFPEAAPRLLITTSCQLEEEEEEEEDLNSDGQKQLMFGSCDRRKKVMKYLLIRLIDFLS